MQEVFFLNGAKVKSITSSRCKKLDQKRQREHKEADPSVSCQESQLCCIYLEEHCTANYRHARKKKGYEWLPNGEIIWVDEAFSHEIEKILQETNDDNERLCSRKQCTE